MISFDESAGLFFAAWVENGRYKLKQFDSRETARSHAFKMLAEPDVSFACYGDRRQTSEQKVLGALSLSRTKEGRIALWYSA